MRAFLIKAIAARQDKCVEIVAAAARASLNVRPRSSQLEESVATRFAQNNQGKEHGGLRSGTDIALTRAPTKIPLKTARKTPSLITAVNR
jgi:hypothetical protein